MQTKIVQLSNEAHKGRKLKEITDFSSYESMNAIPIILPELGLASVELPVVFVEDKNSGSYSMVSLTGVAENENLYIINGRPRGPYTQAALTHTPFALYRNPEDKKQVAILIDENTELLSDTEGELLFTENGENSDYLNKRIKAMFNYEAGLIQTKQFVEKLVELDLITINTFSFERNGIKQKVSGLYSVNETKLRALPAETIQSLFSNGYLAAIHAHLLSLNNFAKLVSYMK